MICHVKIGSIEYDLDLPKGDHITNVIAASGKPYEWDLLDRISRLNIRGGIFVDVGAQVGNHTAYFQRVCKAKHVFCFEPTPESFAYLEKNVLISSATLLNVAAGRRHGSGTLVRHEKNTGMNRVELDGGGDVTVVPLGAVLPEKVDLVKIDVEGTGAAREVVRGFFDFDWDPPASDEHGLSKLNEMLSRRPYFAIEVQEGMKSPEAKWLRLLMQGLKYTWEGPYCKTPTYLFLPQPL